MLVPVLTVELSDPVILSEHEVKRRKENKETGNDYAHPDSRMLWKYREDSWEFYNLAMDIKAGRITEGEVRNFRPAE